MKIPQIRTGDAGAPGTERGRIPQASSADESTGMHPYPEEWDPEEKGLEIKKWTPGAATHRGPSTGTLLPGRILNSCRSLLRWNDWSRNFPVSPASAVKPHSALLSGFKLQS